MPDQDKVQDGVLETPEVELAKPTFEKPSQTNPSELSAEPSVAQFEQRIKDTEERLRREFQSKLDKDTANIRKTYGDLSEVQKALADVKAGGDPDEVYKAIEQRNLYAKVEQLEQRLSAPSQVSTGKSEGDEAFEKAVGLVQKAGVANDPEVQKLFQGTHKSPTDFLFAVNELVLTRNTKTQPSAASASSGAGGGRTAVGAAAIQAQIDSITGDRNKALSVEGRAELKKLAAQLRATEA